ncbi:MAG: MoaD/ThiS family protein [Synergistota bacterium]|nr:MoaD/ThiS family protein [Synergistota bacterium]
MATLILMPELAGGKEKKIELPIDRPLALREVLKMGGVDPAIVGVAVCNGKMLSMDEVIQPGDSIKLLPFIGGG